jgi:hypothetical protein
MRLKALIQGSKWYDSILGYASNFIEGTAITIVDTEGNQLAKIPDQ